MTRRGNAQSLKDKRTSSVDAYEFVLVGVLRRPTFLDFEDLDALSARCPSAVISACPMTPMLLAASRQVKLTCRSIESSIGHFDADKLHSLLFNGEPLVRFPPLLKVSNHLSIYNSSLMIILSQGIGDRLVMGDNSPSHSYNSDAFVQFWAACKSVERQARDLPLPADEQSLASYDDGCWVSTLR